MKIVVIDGQGGKIGRTLTEQLVKSGFAEHLVVIGTNTIATTAMMKAGATAGATGENPVVVNAATADFIVGPIGIIAANSLLGEITPRMAMAVSESQAHKILIPMNRCHITVAGVQELPMTDYIAHAVELICEECAKVSEK